MDHFETFGLARRLQLDEAELQRRFHELSRRYHPDFHHAAPADEQARMLDASARVNAAYRALRDPVARIAYLLHVEEGRPTTQGAAVKPTAPPELLEEMFEIQDALAEARAGGLDDAGRAVLREQRARLVDRLHDQEARLTGPLSAAWDSAAADGRAEVRRILAQGLATRAYLRTVIADLEETLGEAEGTGEHATHHRH